MTKKHWTTEEVAALARRVHADPGSATPDEIRIICLWAAGLLDARATSAHSQPIPHLEH